MNSNVTYGRNSTNEKPALKYEHTYCNNCSKMGHTFYHCKGPITSHGIIAFRINPLNRLNPEYFMIRRKDTFGFIHFVRGKYSVHNKSYLLNIFGQMTTDEKRRLLTYPFDQLWRELWARTDDEIAASASSSVDRYDDHRIEDGAARQQYNSEECISRDKFNELKRGVAECGMKFITRYTLESLIEESHRLMTWTEAEWGFPKGRRNQHEKDFACAIREFSEETGYSAGSISVIENLLPFEETTMGSNYKSYRNKYYLAYMDYATSTKPHKEQTCEVSACEWKSYEDAIASIRDYNVEKKELLEHIECVVGSLIMAA